MKGRAARSAVVAVLAVAAACSPIVAKPLSEAPVNEGCLDVHKCELYTVPGATTKSQCHDGRCDFGLPTYPFTVVVNVPDTSFYAPGRSFLLTNKDLSAQPGTISGNTACKPPLCVPLQELVQAEGRYLVTKQAAVAVGLPLPESTSIPVRVTLVPLADGTLDEAATVGIPAADVLTSSLAVVPQGTTGVPPEIKYADAVPVGRYLRIAYPEPPYDRFFPPAFTTLSENFPSFNDVFFLGVLRETGKTPLDDETGDTRKATVTRAEGLDGWQVWLIDSQTGRRISSLRTLKGTKMTVRLDTVGQTQATSRALKENVEVVVAPPASFIGVPRLQSRIINGQGLEALDVPPLPGPASVTGVVASGEGTALTGIPSVLRFDSTKVRRMDGTADPLLRYSTSVSTDVTGHFATVLPPGLYDVTIEPDFRTSFAKVKDRFDTSDGLAKTYRPPMRTVASGKVVLADGRPLAGADIRAIPSEVPVTSMGTAVKPRPAQTRTDEGGNFSFEVDQGQYDFVVDPQAGTGFPRLVQVRSFATGIAKLDTIVIAPPARLSFTVKDPSRNGNPIVRATVRVFAEPPNRGPPAVEIARSMTDELGQCEILLAQQPR